MTIIHWVLTKIEQVPATFWGVLAGSIFTLLGVWFTNRATERRMRMQFAHERQLREQDRQLAVRKEIFFDLVQALTECTVILAKTTNIQNSDQDLISEFNAKLVSISRSRLVLPTTALPKAEMAFETIQNSLKEALVRRAPILATKAQIDADADDLKGNPSLAGAASSGKTFFERRLEVQKRYRAFQQEIAAYQKEVNVAGASLLLALRIELGIETDPELWNAELAERELRRQSNQEEIFQLQAGESGNSLQP